MREEYTNNLPQWYKSNEKFDLVLSDDIDSLTACAVLKKAKPNWNVEYFYDFNNIYVSDECYSKERKKDTRVWVDVAFVRENMCFDNHISRFNLNDHVNSLCINPNLMTDVANDNYTDKYAGSTALVVWSLYNIPLPLTELGKMLLLCIDSAFKGFYDNRFKERNMFYMHVLGFDELIEVMKRHKSYEFYNLISKYRLNEKIRYNSQTRQLETKLDIKTLSKLLEIDLTLSNVKLKVWREFEQKQCNVSHLNTITKLNKYTLTLAFTYRNQVRFSVLKSEGNND